MCRAVVSAAAAAAMASALFKLQVRCACASVVSRTSMALSKFSEMLTTPEIGKSPHHRILKREYGKKNVVKRLFQPRCGLVWRSSTLYQTATLGKGLGTYTKVVLVECGSGQFNILALPPFSARAVYAII